MSAPKEHRSVAALAAEGFRLALAGQDDAAARNYASALLTGLGRGVPAFMHLNVLRAAAKHAVADRLERLALDFGADISYAGVQAEPNFADALDEYERLMAAGRINARMVARYAQLASLAGDSEKLTRIMDPTRLLRIVTLDTLADDGTQLAEPVAAVMRGETERATWREAYRSTRQVHHIADVHLLDDPALGRLFAAIREQIDCYLTDVGASDHPFFRWRPADPELGAWALISSGPGHNVPHIHPQGWLTGVFYASWRGPALADSVPGEGALHVGPDPLGDTACPGWPSATIAPDPGVLVIMPSYYMHHTLPAREGSVRIAIPFDIVSRQSLLTMTETDNVLSGRAPSPDTSP